MRLIYRGDQEKMIKRLASIVGDSPTDMVFKVLSRLDNEIKEPIDALDAQEILYGRVVTKQQD